MHRVPYLFSLATVVYHLPQVYPKIEDKSFKWNVNGGISWFT